MTMPIARAEELSHISFIVTDLDEAARFISTFGMVIFDRTAGHFYARGTGSAPFVYQARLGSEAAFGSLGIRMANLDDLRAVAAHDGVPVVAFDGPGGGFVARLTTPDGFTIEAMAGQDMRVPDRLEEYPVNQAGKYPRVSKLRHINPGPSHVMRLGHSVFATADLAATEAWFKERFGMITSDEIQLPNGKPMGAFLRLDRGDTPVDHHSLFLMHKAPALFHHVAFEVSDIDDLMRGQEHLQAAGFSHHFGVGRHRLGGQIFDYWYDPFGFQLEHWTDGDCFVRDDGSNTVSFAELSQVGWGEPGFSGAG
jgi:catechol 2,3-dioxygenase-like lactoylglutathione lyase family enzyme